MDTYNRNHFTNHEFIDANSRRFGCDSLLWITPGPYYFSQNNHKAQVCTLTPDTRNINENLSYLFIEPK